ncbi:S-adenosyl-L-methionine-dependent methyltransferase [Phycomyces nitens]|nr:S-adenosyl-L-methionine-dependent methyltransferase [Phycomyces nitens]
MFAYARSLLNSVFPKKRSFEDDQEEQTPHQSKKLKMESTLADETTSQSTSAPEPTYIYRVKVTNLPVRDSSTTKKFFQKLGYSRFKKAPEWDYAFITFTTKEEAENAEKQLNGLKLKRDIIGAEVVVTTEDSYRKRFMSKAAEKKQQEENANDTRTPSEKLADQVTPLHKVPYEKQLQQKERVGIKHLSTLKRNIANLKDISENGKKEIAWARQPGSLPCPISSIIPSPEVNGYRTKCEFTIGKDLDGKRTVGFLLGLYRAGITAVLEPSECLNVSSVAKRIAKAMGDYVRASEYDVYDRSTKTGVWRTLMTKTQRTGDIMIVVQMRAEDLTPEQVEAEKAKLIAYWDSFKDKPEDERIAVTTLLFQIWNGDANGITEKAPTEVLTGDGYVYEELLGCRFRISSSAFFQVNTPATELLYAKCAEWCNIDKTKKTTLLDLCCGTGTIGITMAKSVDRVVGIEMVPEAIVDAKANAQRNNITNVEYFASKVEDRIDVVTNANNEEVVAILDPPRNGVHASVIRAVRESSKINKVIFISCDAKQAMTNFIALCRPRSNRFKGAPFKPTKAISIDLFPHSDHSELMIEFERVETPVESDHETLVETSVGSTEAVETTVETTTETVVETQD